MVYYSKISVLVYRAILGRFSNNFFPSETWTHHPPTSILGICFTLPAEVGLIRIQCELVMQMVTDVLQCLLHVTYCFIIEDFSVVRVFRINPRLVEAHTLSNSESSQAIRHSQSSTIVAIKSEFLTVHDDPSRKFPDSNYGQKIYSYHTNILIQPTSSMIVASTAGLFYIIYISA